MKTFDTVSDLTAATLSADQLVETKGYTTAGDGGQARYLIKTAADFGGTPDEAGDHTLANGNVAVLQPSEVPINVLQFGAVNVVDASTPVDNTAAFLAAWNAAKRLAAVNKGNYVGHVHIPAGDYYLATGSVWDDTVNSGQVYITGDGQDITNLVIGDNQIGLDLICGGCVVEDLGVWSKLTWDATVAAAGVLTISRDTSGKGIYARAGGRPRIKRCLVYGFGDTGIEATRMTNGVIENNRVSGCAIGISIPTPSTTTTTSHVFDNYVSSCDLGYNFIKCSHSYFSNNIAEGGTKGMYASLCTNSIFERMYFESNTDQHYEVVNTRGIKNDISEVDGGAGAPANASTWYFNASVALADIYGTDVCNDGIATSDLAILSYDEGGSANKGFVKCEFRPTLSKQVRGLRINNREDKGGSLNTIGTFPLVNGPKAAHFLTIHVKADGTVIDSDEYLYQVVKSATGEYSVYTSFDIYPEFVLVTPYVEYNTGATTPRFATVAYNNANLDWTEYNAGSPISRIYVVTFDAAGAEVDCGFTLLVACNMTDDLLS